MKILRRMVLGFAQARPPDPPSMVAIDITSSTSITLRLQESIAVDSPIATKFKSNYSESPSNFAQSNLPSYFSVQWSARADFNPVTGEKEILDVSKPSCTIELTQGRRYFCRASCGNLKGYGAHLSAMPASIVPSSWQEVDRRISR